MIDIPGRNAKPAWQALAQLDAGMPKHANEEIHADLMQWLVSAHSIFSKLLPVNQFPETGVKLNQRQVVEVCRDQDHLVAPQPNVQPEAHLELITVDWTLGSEELSARSPYLQQMEKEPCLFVSCNEAGQLGISDGNRVAVRSNAGSIEIHAAVVDNMAPGILVLPRHRRLDWQYLEALRITLNKDLIFRVGEDG